MSDEKGLKRSLEDETDTQSAKRTEKYEKSAENMANVAPVQDEHRQKESDVGIVAYITDLPGFSAVIKERYSDFLVNEILTDGSVVTLTALSAPKLAEEENKSDAANILNAEELNTVTEFYKNSERSGTIKLDVTNKDKETRRKIHESIRNSFPGLDSKTENSDSEKFILILKGCDKQRRQNHSKLGNYAHFVLYKENKDTMDAINKIASALRVPAKYFAYAGTKDKRGKTSQIVSVSRVSAEKLLGLNKRLNLIKIGNVIYKETPTKLGDLSGNKFTIVLRQVKGDKCVINEAMESLSAKGFLNYFGMQRFGTTSVPTHHIGRALLKGEWKLAIDLILKPRDGEDQYLAEARQIWLKTNDATEAFKALRYKGGIEGHLLKGLSNHRKNDLVNALNEIPRNIRLMYIHSYQSYIWNKVLSRRIKEYGLNVLIGDLHLNTDRDEVNLENETDSSQNHKMSPQFVKTELDQDSVYNIVLPLPGHNVSYPDNKIAEFYKEYLEEDDMNFDSFKSKVKSYSLSGSYRKIVIKPKDVTWEFVPYDNSHQSLVLSDYEKLQGLDLLQMTEGSQTALKLEIKLPPSCYATMAIREALKIDTSKSVQSSMNEQC